MPNPLYFCAIKNPLMKRELLITKDGSHTIVIPELNEQYHSINGAIEESLHVFINAGLMQISNQKKEIHILEIGFGTGLNAILTENFSKKNQLKINYTGIEPFPLDKTLIENLNYGDFEFIDSDTFNNIHQIEFDNCFHPVSDGFLIKKICITLEAYQPYENSFDLIYFDAFSPEVQPILWEKFFFEKLYKSLKPNGVLTTYSAKGAVRRTLQVVGFTVERLPGASGKREMLRATKLINKEK